MLPEKIKVPPIKSQGIKTKLVPWIQSVVPADFSGVWVEPFMGTGVVGFNLAPRKAIFCDSNPHLVRFYSALANGQITTNTVRDHLVREGALLLERGEDHYYYIRDRFNTEQNPLDFLFVNRAGFNGMIRFNKKGGFNIPFCRKPSRFAQAYVTKIVNQVDALMGVFACKDFTFKCQNFTDTILQADETSLIYCDPPYIERHADYYNSWGDVNEHQLKDLLMKFKGKFILSTWHHNDFRKNPYIESTWSDFNISTREHFYHVGGSEENRNPMIEALVTNFIPKILPVPIGDDMEQLKAGKYRTPNV